VAVIAAVAVLVIEIAGVMILRRGIRHRPLPA
jgi:hypothetical protein